MKQRNGFVSNSSSSSYIILSKERITEERLFEKINISKNHILYPIAETIVKTICGAIEEGKDEYETFEDYCDEYVLSEEVIKMVEDQKYHLHYLKLNWYNDGEGYGETLIEDEQLIYALFKKINNDPFTLLF